MHASALPLLPAFQTLLLGRAARRARPQVPPEVLQAKSISELRAAFGLLIPDGRWQGPTLGSTSRERLFTPPDHLLGIFVASAFGWLCLPHGAA